jgi:hypothetical protein
LALPAPLHRVIVEEMGKEKAPQLREIEALFQAALASMEDSTKDRVSAKIADLHYRLTKTRFETTQSNPLARNAVDSAKAKDASIIRFAHGKELLTQVRKAIQDKYKVSFGNARIIEAMAKDEVHADVIQVIASIRGVLLA